MTRFAALALALVGFALPFGVLAAPAGAQTLLAAATPAPLTASPATLADFSDRAESLVAGWQRNDVAPTVAAFSDAFRVPGGVAVPRVVRALTRRHGAVAVATAEATTLRADGHTETVVAVRFARGAERLRFVWGTDGGLRTVARAARPAPALATACRG